MTLRTLIVDDESVARRHLARLLRQEPGIEIVGEARSGIDGIRMLNDLDVDLIFLDFQMPDMNGFEVLHLAKAHPLVVFTTAHDQYALTAFRDNALEYLLKPISAQQIARALRKVRATIHRRPEQAAPGALQWMGELRGSSAHILVSQRDSLRPLRLDEIVYLEAHDKCTVIRTSGGAHETDTGLGEFEARLPEADFVRIHRRHIVNIRYIKELKRWGHRQYKVELTAPVSADLYVSRRFVNGVLQRLGGTV